MDHKELEVQHLRNKYLAYCVIRDAIGFYFGIPKFLNSFDREDVIEEQVREKVEFAETKKNRKLSDKEILRYKKSVEKSITNRIEFLKEDYSHCEQILFDENHWLAILDLKGEFLKKYLSQLPEKTKDELAVVPNWSTKDHSLGRPYITDKLVGDLDFA